MMKPGTGLPIRWARRLVVCLGATVAILVALAVIAFGLIQVPAVRQQVVAIAMERVNLLFLGEVRVGRIAGFLPWRASIEDIEVVDLDGRTIARIARIAGDIEPLALLQHTVRVRNLRIEGAWASLLDERGDVTLARAFRPIGTETAAPAQDDEAPSPWVLEAAPLTFAGEAFRGPGLDGRIGAFELDTTLRFAAGFLSWQDLALTVRSNDPMLPDGPIRMRSAGRFGEGRLEVERFEVEAKPGSLVGRGFLHDFEHPRIGFTIDQATADLDALRTWRPDLPVRGLASLTGSVEGPLSDLRLGLVVATDGGRIEIDGAAGVVPEIGPRYDLAIRGSGLSPWRVLMSPEPAASAMAADLTVSLKGEGNPLEIGSAEAVISLDRIVGIPGAPRSIEVRAGGQNGWFRAEAVATGPDDRFATAAVSFPGLATGRAFANAAVRDMDAGGLLTTAGLSGYAGRVSRLDAAMAADGVGSKNIKASGWLQINASSLARTVGPGPAVRIEQAGLSADASWSGTGLPVGTVHADLQGIRSDLGSMDRVRADLAAFHRPGAIGVRGAIRIARANAPNAGTLGSLDVPLDLRIPLAGGFPSGRIGLSASRLDSTFLTAGNVRLDANLSTSGPRLTVTGPLSAKDVAGVADVRSGSIDGVLTAVLDNAGLIRGDVRIATDGVGLGAGRGVGRTRVDASLARRTGTPGTYDGRVRADVRDAGLSPDIRIGTMNAEATAMLVSGRGLPAVDVDVALKQVELFGRSLDSAGLRATLPREGPATVNANADGRNLRLVLDAQGVLPGPDRSPWVRVRRLEARDGDWGLTMATEGGIRIEQDGILIAEGLRLGGSEEGRDDMIASGRLDPATGALQGRIEARGVDLAALPERVRRMSEIALDPGLLPGGIADLDVTVQGTLAVPIADVRIALRDSSYGAMKNLALSARVRLGGPVARLEADVTWSRGSRLDVELDAPFRIGWESDETGRALRIGLDRAAPFRLSATLAGVDLAGFGDMAGPTLRGLEGTVTGEFLLEGSLAEPHGRLKLRAERARLGSLRDIEADIDAVLAADRTSVRAGLHQGDESVILDAQAPIHLVSALASTSPIAALRHALTEHPFSVAFEVANLRPGRLPFLSYAGNGMFGPTVLNGAVSVSGTLPAIVASGRIEAKQVLIGFLQSDVRLGLVQQGADLAIQVDVLADDKPFSAATALVPGGLSALVNGSNISDLFNNPNARIGVTTVRLPIPTVARLLPEAGRNLATLVPEGELSLAGQFAGGKDGAVGRINVRIEAAPDAPASVRGLSRSIRLDVDLGPNRTTAAAEVLQDDDGGGLKLDAQAGIGTRALVSGATASFPIAASLASRDFALNELSTVFPSVFGPTRGKLVADIRLSGTFDAPRVEGTLEARFDDLRLSMAGLRQRDLVLALEIVGRKVHLRPVHLVAGGTLDLAFDATVDALRASAITLDGRLDARHFQAMNGDETSLRLSTDLAIGGTLARPMVKGDVTVESARSTASLVGRAVTEPGLPADVSFEDGSPTAEAPASQGGLQAKVPADLDVRLAIASRGIHLRNELVDVFVTGNLHVRTARDDLVLTGVVSVDEGQVVLYGRKFSLNEDSRVIFTGSPGINPSLDVTADFAIRDVDLSALGLTAERDSRISVQVTGTAEHPQLKLSSQPPMDDTNIVSIVTMGTPIGAAQSEQTSLEAQTTNLVVGLATGAFSQLLQGELPIDVFQYSPSTEAAGAAEVTVGKRVMRNLMVLYRANIGSAANDQNMNEIEVQYNITPRIQLRTRYGDAGQGSLDLLLRWRY